MSVLPITDTKTSIKWVNQQIKIRGKKEAVIQNDDETLAFVTDFTSPADVLKKSNELHAKSEKAERKGKPLSYTSENWIG